MTMERSFYYAGNEGNPLNVFPPAAYADTEQNDKPGYVANDHLSRIIVADDLQRPT